MEEEEEVEREKGEGEGEAKRGRRGAALDRTLRQNIPAGCSGGARLGSG